MDGKRTSMSTFALLFASFLLLVSGAVPLTRDLLRDPTGVLQGFPARTRLPTVAFSPDGTRLGVLGHGAVVTLWDVASGQKGPVLKSQGTDIMALAFDPSGRSVAGVGADDRIILWDLSTGVDRLTLFPGPLGSNVRAVGFSPDGTALASLGDDSSVIVWDAATGNATYVLSGHSDAITGVAFSPDRKLLASASRDSTVALWDLSIGKERVTLNSPSPIVRLAFSADGGTLTGVGQEGVFSNMV